MFLAYNKQSINDSYYNLEFNRVKVSKLLRVILQSMQNLLFNFYRTFYLVAQIWQKPASYL